MTAKTWLSRNARSLAGKSVAISGATGGLGRELCRYLVQLDARLILLDRSESRSAALQAELRALRPAAQLSRIPLELEDPSAVAAAARALAADPPDVLILNAGAYSIPRHRCETGLDNVFQIDFASPYCLVRALLPAMRQKHTRVVAVGSIANGYSHADPADIDFSTRRSAAKVYGNAKRYLMYAIDELFSRETDTTLSIVHPGITFTNITAHYPKWLFAIIKYPMKVIFMPPRRAALSLLSGVFWPVGRGEWSGPWLFSVWGLPVRCRLRGCPPEERQQIFSAAEQIADDFFRRTAAPQSGIVSDAP